jgi:putative ABC transport system permease protein
MLSRLWIRCCAFLVPAAMRSRWREEWLAEIAASTRRFDTRVLGAVVDSVQVRQHQSTGAREHRSTMMSGFWYDVRSGLRQLQRHRGFTALAVCVLALGIGINSAIFSIVYTVFFKPWPIDKPEEVAFIYRNQVSGFVGSPTGFYPEQKKKEFLDSNPGIAAMGAFWGMSMNVGVDGLTERTRGEMVTPNYFDVLGIRPILGRTFEATDNRTNPDMGVVIGYALWQERFAGASDVIGRRIRLNYHDVPIIGVVGREFTGLNGVWTPARLWVVGEQFFPMGGLGSFVRLKPGVSVEQAEVSANIFGARETEEMRKRSPRFALPPGAPLYFLKSINDVRTPQDYEGRIVPERVAAALAVVVLMVLVIATINITGLLLARGMSRTNELATRRALGVTPLRLARQLLTETMLLSFAGGALGLLLAWNLINLFTSLTPDRFTVEAGFDVRVVAFTAAACLATGLLIGLAPVRQALKVDVLTGLAGGYRDSGQTGRRLRHWVVVPQVALSLVLLIVTGVHVRSLQQFDTHALGYEPDRATILSLQRNTPEEEPGQKRRPPEEIAREYQIIYRNLHNMLSAMPGLTAGLVGYLPLRSAGGPDVATSERSSAQGRPDDLPVQRVSVSPGAFNALGMRLLDGRDFDDRDTRQVRAVAIVSQSVARRLWPNQNPIGQQVGAMSPQQTNAKVDWYEVIGVVNDTKAVLATANDASHIYVSLGQAWRPWAWNLVVRSAEPDTIAKVRAAVGGIDPFTAANEVRTMKALVDELLYPRRLAATILGVSGVVGLGLSCVGLYGVVSFSVARRLRELGIRATLGALPRDLVRLILEEGGRMAAIGTVIGLAGGVAALRYSAHMADGIPTTDWLVFVLVPVVLTLVLLVACYVPARRAGLVDPVDTLRE